MQERKKLGGRKQGKERKMKLRGWEEYVGGKGRNMNQKMKNNRKK